MDDRLWARFKARAESEGRGRGLKFILLRLVDLYSRVGLDVLEQAAQESR